MDQKRVRREMDRSLPVVKDPLSNLWTNRDVSRLLQEYTPFCLHSADIQMQPK